LDAHVLPERVEIGRRRRILRVGVEVRQDGRADRGITGCKYALNRPIKAETAARLRNRAQRIPQAEAVVRPLADLYISLQTEQCAAGASFAWA
jgi:hypothetical protein